MKIARAGLGRELLVLLLSEAGSGWEDWGRRRAADYTASNREEGLGGGGQGGGGGVTHPSCGYPLQNRPQELWLSTRTRLEKRGTQV